MLGEVTSMDGNEERFTEVPAQRDIYPICPRCGGSGMRLKKTPTGKLIWICTSSAEEEKCGGIVRADDRGYPVYRKSKTSTQLHLIEAAHRVFDRLWSYGLSNASGSSEGARRRNLAYEWLSLRTGINPDRCHMGQLTEEELLDVIILSANRLRYEGPIT